MFYWFSIFLSFVGFTVILRYLMKNLEGFWHGVKYLIKNEEINTTLIEKYGNWALVTGSTDGIGKAYAKELAKRGINLVLVSRSKEKLENTSKEIESEFNVQTKIIPVDLSLGAEAVKIVKDNVKDIEVGILINNVGAFQEFPMYLNELTEGDILNMITLNVTVLTLMCRVFIVGMLSRRKGAIVNVSSGADLQPVPLMAVYAATKAYVKSFTAAIQCEYNTSGLTIQNLVPFYVNTKMANFADKFKKNTWVMPTPETYAKYAITTLGKQKRSTGFWFHGIQYFIFSLIPEYVKLSSGKKNIEELRNDYLEKKKLKKL